jgi:serine protease Do
MKSMKITVFMVMAICVFIGWKAQAATSDESLKSLMQLENVFVDIADRVKPTVVNISEISTPRDPSRSQSPGQRPPDRPGSGSGVIIDRRGYIVTNNHVVGGADEVEVRLSDKRKFIGKVVGKDPDTDLAVVKIETDANLPTVNWGDSGKVKVGQWVMAVGNPFGLDRTVTVGVISALGRENVQLSRYEDFLQTDASINPGNSGGPLFNIKGEVIGINTAIINFAQGIGFAIPSNMAQDVTGQLMARGKVVRGWLGVGIQAITDDLAGKFGVKEGEGVLVNEIFEGDPAAQAGLQPGDIIVKVNGQLVDTPQTLSRLIAGQGPGKKVDLEVIRDGKKKNLTVLLTERKEEAVVASIPRLPESQFGITVQDLTVELADRFKLKDSKGAVITRVEPGSIAESEGLKEGDLVREINRMSVDNVNDFKKALEAVKKGDSVLVRVIRENRAFYVVLKPEPKE